VKVQNRNAAILGLCLVIIFMAGLVNLAVKTNYGDYVVKEIKIAPYGPDFTASLYIPKSVLKTDKEGNFLSSVPAVIVNPGFTNTRTASDVIALQLVRGGFVVINIDMYGHGSSDAINNRGYPNPPSPFDDDVSLLGAADALAYLRTLGFVDQTRIGMCGHSLGGSACGRMAAKSAGFYTLQDQLLNMLKSEFGVSVTSEQVNAQNADTVAASSLNDGDLALYRLRKSQIVKDYNLAVRSYLIFDSDPAGSAPHVVEVAGIPVWRDVQANMGLVMNISGNVSEGMRNKDGHLSANRNLTTLALANPAERDTWYAIKVSNTQERQISAKLTGFYDNTSNSSVKTAAESNRLRMITTPFGYHGFTPLSIPTAKAAMQFFRTCLEYDNGMSLTAKNWVFKEATSGIGCIALLVLILPLINILLEFPFFASLHGTPQEPLQSKKSAMFWISMIIFVAVPAITYTKGGGWGAIIPPTPFTTMQLPTMIVFWALIMTAILFVLTVIKYAAYDKKKFGVSFTAMYGLKYGWKNIGKSIVLALVVFGFVSLLLTVYYNLFGAADLKFTPGGNSIIFMALSKSQYYNWLLYAIYFFPFYLFNSMMVNSARLKDMSEKNNMLMITVMNGIGMFILAFLQFVPGYLVSGRPLFTPPPGSSSVVYNLSVFCVMLFLSAVFSRKLYLKTGSPIPGALLNAFIFTIPTIQAFTFYSFL